MTNIRYAKVWHPSINDIDDRGSTTSGGWLVILNEKCTCCSQASLPWFSSWWLWGHTPGSHDQVNWVPDSGQRSQCQGFFAASLLHSVGCMAFHFQWLVYSEGSGQLIWKKVARRVKQSSVQGASFCKPGQVLAAASTSYLMRNMIAVKELTWQLASGWGRYFGW